MKYTALLHWLAHAQPLYDSYRSYEEEQMALTNMLLHSETSSCVPVTVLPLRRCATLPDARGVGSNNTCLAEDDVMAQQQLTSCTPALRRRRERECKYVTDQSQLNLRFHRPAHRHRQRPVSASASTDMRMQQSIRHRSVRCFLLQGKARQLLAVHWCNLVSCTHITFHSVEIPVALIFKKSLTSIP